MDVLVYPQFFFSKSGMEGGVAPRLARGVRAFHADL